jgi:hypothetical protein
MGAQSETTLNVTSPGDLIMTKQLSAVLAAAAFIAVSGPASANGGFPFSVNETGPVLTAQQQAYQEQWQASRHQAKGVTGKAGSAAQSESAEIREVHTPSNGGPIDG